MKATAEQIEVSSLRSSQADVWFLKEIKFGDGEHKRRVKIITQNFNGPCSFIAICNILILRGKIEILPYERTSVSYEFLSQLVGEYLLVNCADTAIDISSALSIMPTTTKGLDLNPQFTAVDSFRPRGDGGELQLFAEAGIKLVHGWVVDPESRAATVLSRVSDYDSAVMLIADADHLTKGRLLHSDAFNDTSDGSETRPSDHGGDSNSGGGSQAGSSLLAGPSNQPIAGPSNHYHHEPCSPIEPCSEEDRHKIASAVIAQEFLDSTKSQLTYYGLFQLAASVEQGSLVALFRNSHLSVLYKPNGEDCSLYSLVTDHVFLHESSVVWERFEDIDGGSSTFVDSDFVKSTPVGGDFAGQTAEAALRAFEDPADRELAKRLQAEEDARAYQIYLERQRRSKKQASEAAGESASRKHKKCIIM
ncbi:hypothetical protein V8B97DRAFT_1948536 [Scleroderma yunnanense]